MARNPQSANDYDDRTTAAAKAVLLEIGQILGSFRGKFALIGGAVPSLLIDSQDMKHVGTVDIDLCLDPEALKDGEYRTLVEALMEAGYKQTATTKRFQLARTVGAGGDGPLIEILVDFLMARDAVFFKNRRPLWTVSLCKGRTAQAWRSSTTRSSQLKARCQTAHAIA